MLGILGCARGEDVEIASAKHEGIEGLGDERYTCYVLHQQPRHTTERCASLPSELLLECIAHIKMSFDDVCETSPRMWNKLNFMAKMYVTATQREACRLLPRTRVSKPTCRGRPWSCLGPRVSGTKEVTSVAFGRVGAMQGMLLRVDDGVEGVGVKERLVGDAIDSWRSMPHVLVLAWSSSATWQPCMALAPIELGLHPPPGLRKLD